MLIEIKNDGPLGAIVLQGGSFPTEGIPYFYLDGYLITFAIAGCCR